MLYDDAAESVFSLFFCQISEFIGSKVVILIMRIIDLCSDISAVKLVVITIVKTIHSACGTLQCKPKPTKPTVIFDILLCCLTFL